MSFRLLKPNAVSIVALLVLLPRPQSAPGPSADAQNSLEHAKRLAWLNNWAEAANELQTLESDGRLPGDAATFLFSRAAQIRGRIESLSLPEAARELTTILSSEAHQNLELRTQILAIRGDIEFQYDLSAARKTWLEAREIAEREGYRVWCGRADGELGTIAFLNGEILTGLKLVSSAVLRAELYGDISAQIRYRTALGEGLAQFGRTADAIRFYEKALQLSEETPGAYFPFTAYLGKARLFAATGREVEGRRMLLDGLDQARAKKLRVREARLLTALGEFANASARTDEAVEWLRAATTVARNSGLHRIESDATGQLAAIAHAAGNVATASNYARRSLAAARTAGELYSVPQKLATLAEIEAAQGKLAEADAAYRKATDVIDGLIGDLHHPRHQNTLIATMERVFQGHFDLSLNRLGDPEKALQVLESARARGLTGLLRSGSESGSGPREALPKSGEIADLHRELSFEDDPARRRGLLDRLWELEVRSFRPESAGRMGEIYNRAMPVPLRLLQSSLEEGEVIIEFALGSSASFALAIDRTGIASYRLKDAGELEAAVNRYLLAVRGKRDARDEARLLYKLLLAPVALAAPGKRLVIIPDRALHLVPFGALIDDTNRYVIERSVVSYAPSATVHHLLSRASAPRPAASGLLAVGGARYAPAGAKHLPSSLRGRGFFDPAAPSLWSALPKSMTEVAGLAAWPSGRTQLLTGRNARESILKQTPLSNFGILHFAVHSTVDEEFPDRSALVLSPSGDRDEDDLLQAREILGLDLKADLVTLSACDTGAGKIEGIAGMNSLVQAFLMAGSRTVVASIWPAEDTFTAALMRRFYDHLRKGAEKAEALTLAKRELIQMHGPNAVPFYWAGFRLVGDPHGRLTGE